jgi:hypothetical protein
LSRTRLGPEPSFKTWLSSRKVDFARRALSVSTVSNFVGKTSSGTTPIAESTTPAGKNGRSNTLDDANSAPALSLISAEIGPQSTWHDGISRGRATLQASSNVGSVSSASSAMRAEAGKILLELEVVRKTASFIYSSPIFPTTKPQKNRSADSADPLQIRGARGLWAQARAALPPAGLKSGGGVNDRVAATWMAVQRPADVKRSGY